MADNDGIVVAGGDPGAELLAVVRLKILFRGDKDIGGWIEPQELRRPLLRQVVGNRKQTLAAQPQPLALHSGGDHFKGLACPYFVGKEGVAAIKNVSNSIELMLTEPDFRVHAGEDDVLPVILAGAGGIEKVVVLSYQRLAAVRVFPHPLLKSVLDGLLFLLGEGGLLAVEDALFLAVSVHLGVIDADVAEIERFLQNLVGVGPLGAVGHAGVDVAIAHGAFAGDVPFCGVLGEIHPNIPPQIIGRVKGLLHELLDIPLVDPGRAQTHINLRGVQILGLGLFQRLHIGGVIFRVELRRASGPFQLFPHIAGEVLVGWQILFLPAAAVAIHGVEKDNAFQLPIDFFLG